MEGQTCSPLGGNPGILWDSALRTDGATVVISCQAGYVMEGDEATITCTRGTWIPALPVCKEISQGGTDVLTILVPILAGLACLVIIGLAIYMACRRHKPTRKQKYDLQQKKQKMERTLWSISQHNTSTQDVVGMPAIKHTTMDKVLRGRPNSSASVGEGGEEVSDKADVSPSRDFSY